LQASLGYIARPWREREREREIGVSLYNLKEETFLNTNQKHKQQKKNR
jgi:hypothetical protein